MKITKEYSKTHSKDADYVAAYVAASAAVDADYAAAYVAAGASAAHADAKTKIVNHGIKLIGDLK